MPNENQIRKTMNDIQSYLALTGSENCGCEDEVCNNSLHFIVIKKPNYHALFK